MKSFKLLGLTAGIALTAGIVLSAQGAGESQATGTTAAGVKYILSPNPDETIVSYDNVAQQYFSIEFPDNKNVAYYENSRPGIATLENKETGDVYYCTDPFMDTRAESNGKVFYFDFAEYGATSVTPIFANGTYELTIQGFYLTDEEGDVAQDIDPITVTYIFDGYNFNPGTNDGTPEVVTDLNPMSVGINFYGPVSLENAKITLTNSYDGKSYVGTAEGPQGSYSFAFAATADGEAVDITAPGLYTLTITGAVYNMVIDAENDVVNEVKLPDYTQTYLINPALEVSTDPNYNGQEIGEDEVADGIVSDLSQILVTFENYNNVYFKEGEVAGTLFTPMGIYVCVDPIKNTRATTTGCQYVFTFVKAEDNYEDEMPLTTPGQYYLQLENMYLENAAGVQIDAYFKRELGYRIEAPIEYTIYNNVWGNLEQLVNGQDVDSFNVLTIQFTNENVKFYANTQATLYNSFTNETYTGTINGSNGSYDITFDPSVTAPGDYTLTLTGMYLQDGEAAITLPNITQNYYIPVTYLQAAIYPEAEDNGRVFTAINNPNQPIVVVFPENTNVVMPEPSAYKMILENSSTGALYYAVADKLGRSNYTENGGSAYQLWFYTYDQIAAIANGEIVEPNLITEPGAYRLVITGLNLQNEENGPMLPVLSAVSSDNDGGPFYIYEQVDYILDPEDGSTVSTLGYCNDPSEISVTFSDYMGQMYSQTTAIKLVYEETGMEFEGYIYSVESYDEFGNFIGYKYTLGFNSGYNDQTDDYVTALDLPGTYTLTIQDFFTLENQHQQPAYIAPITATYYVAPVTELTNYSFLPKVMVQNPYNLEQYWQGKYSPSDVDLAVITLEIPNFEANSGIQIDNTVRPYVATLENLQTGDVYYCTEASVNPDNVTSPNWEREFSFIFQNEDGEIVKINNPGDYKLTIKGLYKTNGNDDQVFYQPIVEYYRIWMAAANVADRVEGAVTYYVTPADESTLEQISAVTFKFPEYGTAVELFGYEYVDADNSTYVKYDEAQSGLYGYYGGGYGDNLEGILVPLPVPPYGNGLYEFDFSKSYSTGEGFDGDETSWNNGKPVTQPGNWTFILSNVLVPNTNAMVDGFNGPAYYQVEPIEINYVITPYAGVSSVLGDESYDVYTINGVQVVKNGNANDVDNLQPGMYIINGKKVLVSK